VLLSEKPANLISDRFDKRIHVALPIRVTYWDAENRPRLEMACTYDISPHGARIVGLRCVKEAGEIIAVERGRNKAFCRVVWIGEDNSELKGQIGLQCIENQRQMWEAEIRQMEETYEPINRGQKLEPRLPGGTPSRRRAPRFAIDGIAELMKLSAESQPGMEVPIKNIGEAGCLVSTQSALKPGTSLRLVLNIANYDLTVRGEVRHAALDVGLGIEFHEIRKGDRPVLQHILRKLAEQERERDESKDAALGASVSL
jgi:hypothetical protein